MKRRWLLGFLASLTLVAGAQELRAIAQRDRVELFATSRVSGRPIGYLPRDSEVEVVGRSADGLVVQLSVLRANGQKIRAYARSRDFRYRRVETPTAIERLPVVDVPPPGYEAAAGEEPADFGKESDLRHKPRPCQIAYPWGFGASFSGYSAGDKTNVTVSGDIRYLWCSWTETILGLDLGLGSDFLVGARAGQRFYAPFGSFRPFVHTGYRIFDLSRSETSALEFGGGFQVEYRQGSYFEIQVLYLWNTVFNSEGTNAIVFNGGSGFRF